MLPRVLFRPSKGSSQPILRLLGHKHLLRSWLAHDATAQELRMGESSFRVSIAVVASAYLEIPKSAKHHCPFNNSMFSGLMSRCTTLPSIGQGFHNIVTWPSPEGAHRDVSSDCSAFSDEGANRPPNRSSLSAPAFFGTLMAATVPSCTLESPCAQLS